MLTIGTEDRKNDRRPHRSAGYDIMAARQFVPFLVSSIDTQEPVSTRFDPFRRSWAQSPAGQSVSYSVGVLFSRSRTRVPSIPVSQLSAG